MYNPTRQYRCDIIRGKSQSDMDNLLPAYAKIIDDLCPCSEDEFAVQFDERMRNYVSGAKTLANHRTEIAGKLFGMYSVSADGTVFSSNRTKKFLADSDAPAFFKDICYKMQFPNGTQKWQTLKERLTAGVKLRQFPFLLKAMTLARMDNITLTVREIGYYILNSLDVLTGAATPYEVVAVIKDDRTAGVERSIPNNGKADSYVRQHIREQINLLELANLVTTERNSGETEVRLNPREERALSLFCDEYRSPPAFDVYAHDLSDSAKRKEFYSEWNNWFSSLSDAAPDFDTTADALGIPAFPVAPENEETADDTESTTVIGDEGERYVFEYEKKRVTAFNFRLANRVLHLGKTRGLGYDIQSVVALSGGNSDFVKYIEVKATKRVTAPNINAADWIDTINITRNEWVAAHQFKDYYSVFRVYFTRRGVTMFIISDLAKKITEELVASVPTTYRIDFGRESVDEVIPIEGGAFSA